MGDTKSQTYLDILLAFAFSLYIILGQHAIFHHEKYLEKKFREKYIFKISPTKQTKPCICPYSLLLKDNGRERSWIYGSSKIPFFLNGNYTPEKKSDARSSPGIFQWIFPKIKRLFQAWWFQMLWLMFIHLSSLPKELAMTAISVSNTTAMSVALIWLLIWFPPFQCLSTSQELIKKAYINPLEQ